VAVQRDDVIGQSIFNLVPENPEFEQAVRRAIEGEEVYSEQQSQAGQVYDTYYTPFYNASGEVQGMIGLALDVSERKRMQAELNEMKHHLMESVEAERLRVAQQLHDGPLQDLYGVYYQLQEIRNPPADANLEIVEKALDTIQQVNATLRFICGELRPTTLVHLGLKKAIRSHAERLQERTVGLSIYLDLMDDAQALDPSIRLGLYRIYQSLINNVVRHADARHVWVRLIMTPDEVTLEVQDNGKGFEVPKSWIELVRKGHFGLASMLERAEAMQGKVDVKTQLGKGTLIRVTVRRQRI
jgi:signal transduction histidine kinase